jgi:hypothetical protein
MRTEHTHAAGGETAMVVVLGSKVAAIGRPAPLAADTDTFGFPLTSRNRCGSPVQDTLEMTLRTVIESVGGEQWHGFTVSYTWRSAERRIHWLAESVAARCGSMPMTSP